MNSNRPNPTDPAFEQFRKSRKQGQMHAQTAAALDPSRKALKDIERHETTEVLQQRLRREMQEFFNGATRLAATILAAVKEQNSSSLSNTVATEMQEFLRDSARKAGALITALRKTGVDFGDVAIADVEVHLKALSVEDLDRFRALGTAKLADKHFGKDPYEMATGSRQTVEVSPQAAAQMNVQEEVAHALRVLEAKGILDEQTLKRLNKKNIVKRETSPKGRPPTSK